MRHGRPTEQTLAFYKVGDIYYKYTTWWDNLPAGYAWSALVGPGGTLCLRLMPVQAWKDLVGHLAGWLCLVSPAQFWWDLVSPGGTWFALVGPGQTWWDTWPADNA